MHSVVVQSLRHVQLFVIPWTAAHQEALNDTLSVLYNILTYVLIITYSIHTHTQIHTEICTENNHLYLSLTYT